MSQPLSSRVRHAWNVFLNRDPTTNDFKMDYGYAQYAKPDRMHFSRGNEKSIVTSVYNRIAMDVAAISIQQVRLDENDRFVEMMQTPLNECLTLSANLDQTSRAFFQDVVMSMFDEGCIAIVPIETDGDPDLSDSYNIYSLRVGKS